MLQHRDIGHVLFKLICLNLNHLNLYDLNLSELIFTVTEHICELSKLMNLFYLNIMGL